MRIIDARVRLRTEQLMKAWTTELKPVFTDYVHLYKMEKRLTIIPVPEMLAGALESSVERMVVCGGSRQDNDHILEISKEHPEVIPVAGVDLSQGCKSALEAIGSYKERGFAGINIAPFMDKLDVNDKRFYPLYAYCELLKVPIIMHASIHYWRAASMWHGQPQYVDEVAVDFPELRIIMSHGGNGFGPLVLAVAQRHPNVYLEFSALNPDYMAPEFIRAANTYLSRKCMFGTDYPLLDFDAAIAPWKEALRETVWERFFYQNVLDALFDDPTAA